MGWASDKVKNMYPDLEFIFKKLYAMEPAERPEPNGEA